MSQIAVYLVTAMIVGVGFDALFLSSALAGRAGTWRRSDETRAARRAGPPKTPGRTQRGG
jgi:hypothetical protein